MCTEIMDAVRQYFKSKIIHYLNIKGPGIPWSLSKVTAFWTVWCSIPARGKFSPSAKPPGLTAGPTQPPVKWVTGNFSWVKAARIELLPLCSAEVKNEWIYNLLPLYTFMSFEQGQLQFLIEESDSGTNKFKWGRRFRIQNLLCIVLCGLVNM